jgi:hypothetical protein
MKRSKKRREIPRAKAIVQHERVITTKATVWSSFDEIKSNLINDPPLFSEV